VLIRGHCVFFDNFKAQRTDGILQLLEDNNIDCVFVPANCTGELQPMDLSVNKSVKDVLRAQFQDWYAAEVLKTYDPSGTEIKPVKFLMGVMKPLGAQWILKMYDHLLAHPDIIRNGFKAAGIVNFFSK